MPTEKRPSSGRPAAPGRRTVTGGPAVNGQSTSGSAGAGRPRRSSARTPWGSISRDEIVATAVRMLKDVGFDQLTIRALAAEMGVAPMSLYRHVRDKDDIIDEVVERLQARIWRPRADPSDWKAYVTEAADKLRSFLVSQPAALHVYLNHPVMSPSALARMDALTEVLRRATGDEQVARQAYAALQTYTIGFAALEASRAGWAPREDGNELAVQMAAYTTPRQFAEGLHYLLTGLEQQAGRPPGRKRAARG